MSILDKLNIRGIRSFGPSEEEKIKFSAPLTLILGQNGCGKTTIIECLNYCLTGELPNGTDGGRGFVNDPQLSNKNTTKASIKLKFKDSKGDDVTVGKFLEVSTIAGGKLRFKSLNPTVRWEDRNSGRVEDISGRCADIDIYCSQKLNVSKAIINNVILCHQENSYWPLEEAKKLKDKFDAIFDATEYNKCVDRFRKLIKDKKVSIKVLKEQFEMKAMAKRNTEKLKSTLSEREERLELLQKSIAKKRESLEPLQKRLDEINEIIDTLSSTQQKLMGMETTLKGLREQEESLKKHLKEEYEGTDEDLENEINNFDSFKDEAKTNIMEKEAKKSTIDAKILQINQIVQKKQVLFGQLKQEETQQIKRSEELKELIEKAKGQFAVIADEADPAAHVLAKLNDALRNDEAAFNAFCKTIEEKEAELQTQINKIRDKFAATKENISSNRKLIDETKKKISETNLKLSRLSHSNSKLEAVNKKIQEAEDALQKKRAEFDDEKETHDLEELDATINQKERDQSKLDKEYRVLQQNYATEQNIDSKNTTLMEKRAEIDTLMQTHEEHFQIIFGEDKVEEKFELAVRTLQKREEQKVKTLTQDISSREKKIVSLEASFKHASEQLKNLQDELNRDKSKIESVCQGRVFTDVLNDSYIKKEKLQKDKGAYRSAKTLFEQFIGQFQRETPCCPVCATDFSSKKSVVPNIINTLRKKIEDIPRKLNETELQLKKEEELYNKLQQLSSVSQNIEMLEEAKIPLLNEELAQNQETLEEVKMELASLKNDLVQPQNLVETCRIIGSDAILLDRLQQEVKKLENEIEDLKRDLVKSSSTRTLHQTETELSKLQAELNNLRKQYRTKRDLIDDTKNSIQWLNSRLQSEMQKKLETQKLMQEQPLLEKQIQEYKESIAKLEGKEKQLIEVKAKIENELGETELNRNEKVRRNKKELDQKRMDLECRKRLIDDILKLHNAVERYERGDHKLKLEETLTELEKCKNDIRTLEETKKILINAIMKKKEELAGQEHTFRTLNDNRDLRLSRKKIKELENNIRELRRQFGNHNSKSICNERKKVMESIDAIQSEINRKSGEQDSIEENIRIDKLELNKKEHKEAITAYKKKYYELRLEELSVGDLELYTEGLEKSILKFHQERMVQINMTIRELWRNIYRGNDIDYIEIKTVDEIGGGARRRSYNYKVVQVKKGIELEMRGRCSAGQKVLACLVIRMALAETFSTSCGILALDEPTTNLDKDNIMSLSDALSTIISMRQRQKNFQLLIITHDEEFLQTITRGQSVSHYFRVQRNADGFSEIQKEIL